MGYFVINVIALDRTLFNTDIIKGPSVRLESLLQQVCTDILLLRSRHLVRNEILQVGYRCLGYLSVTLLFDIWF